MGMYLEKKGIMASKPGSMSEVTISGSSVRNASIMGEREIHWKRAIL
jgi:hypothetical protein